MTEASMRAQCKLSFERSKQSKKFFLLFTCTSPSALNFHLNSLSIRHHGSLQLRNFLHSSMRAVAKGSVVGLFTLAQPIVPSFRYAEFGGPEFRASGIVEMRSVHDFVMTA